MLKDRVLILSSTTLPTIVSVLTEAGYEVDIVEDPAEGLRSVANNGYQLVIYKEEPLGSAWFGCLQIRQLTDIPIIVISHGTSKQALVEAINTGADYFLREPVSALELVARIKALLRRTILAPVCPAGSTETVKPLCRKTLPVS